MKGDHLVGKYYVEFDKHYKAQIKELVAAGQSEEEAKKNAPIMRQAQEWLRPLGGQRSGNIFAVGNHERVGL